MRQLLIRLGLWIARLGGWTPECCPRPHLPEDETLAMMLKVVRDIETRMPSAIGTVKAREAVRVIRNVAPQAKRRDLNLLIELAVQGL